MNQKILVTGGSGLLGSYMVRWFLYQGYQDITATYATSVDAIPDDLRDKANWVKLVLPDTQHAHELVAGKDWVIHAAGYVSYRRKDKHKLMDINKTGTAHIVNACLEHGVTHLIYISSIATLGKEKNHVTLHESAPWLDNEFSTGYGLSKYLGELEAWRGAGEGLNVSVVLPSVILGAGDWNSSSLQLIKRVATKSGWYPGGQTGFVDVRDVASFIGRLLEKSNSGERWILNGKNVSYQEMYHQIGILLDLHKTFQRAPKWLAKLILLRNEWLSNESLGMETLEQSYATFSYDASKSTSLDGFIYRDLAVTLKQVTGLYSQNDKNENHLRF